MVSVLTVLSQRLEMVEYQLKRDLIANSFRELRKSKIRYQMFPSLAKMRLAVDLYLWVIQFFQLPIT